MRALESCPVCGGELLEKEVEKLLRGGGDTAVIWIQADVCLKCGERLYSEDTVRKFEDIRRRLEAKDTSGFEAIGKSFRVPR